MSKRNWVASLIAGAALLMVPALASATTISLDRTSSQYLGSISNPEPSSPTDEEGYINTLIDQTSPSGPTTISGHSYIRTSNTCGTCPDATAAGPLEIAGQNGGDNMGSFGSGYTYLLAKYDGPNDFDLVWYVAGLSGDFVIPTTDNGFGLSHWQLFDPTTTRVPEPATLALFGLGLLGVGRKLIKHQA